MSRLKIQRLAPNGLGFTLIEVVLALTLTSLLLGVLFSVTLATERTTRKLQIREISRSPVPRWLPLLEEDLARATSIDFTARPLRIEGPVGRDPGSLLSNGIAATVRYRVLPAGSQDLLVREQVNTAAQTIENGFVTPLDTDVASLILSPAITAEASASSNPYKAPLSSVGLWVHYRKGQTWQTIISLH